MLFREGFLKYFVVILCLKFLFVFSYRHEKPVAKTLWSQQCVKNQRALNDCNWCICNEKLKFVCKARVCNEVDMFGHFNDAIREHIVGMEGHGSWRSNGTICQPRMQYQREDLLCICNDDGNWPNPVCRDIFRMMHEVKLTKRITPSPTHECTPQNLYLYGCNVCMCPHTARIDPDMCTQNNCSDNDPVFKSKDVIEKESDGYDLSEVYADCELDRKYMFGCKKCICLKNNRLLCDNCKNELSARTKPENESQCSGYDPFQLFSIDCNICVCDKRNKLFCTTKRCLSNFNKPALEFSKSIDMTLRSVNAPIDSLECIPGTKYRYSCNTCFCTEGTNKIKTLSCTKRPCGSDKDVLNAIKEDCVEGTVYEVNCLVCRCDIVDGVKRESCLVDSKCRDTRNVRDTVPDLNSLHGYCEPSHMYKKDCNTCRCLSDGKVVMCSARICKKYYDQPITVDIIPVSQPTSKPCPKNHMYKIDCNFCFCLSNGNILCTTAKCSDAK